MDIKKWGYIRICLLTLVFGVLSFVFHINAMSMVKKLPPAFQQRLSKPGMSMMRAHGIITKAEKKAKIAKAKEELQKHGEVYVYNKKTGDGYIFGKDVVSLCFYLRGLLDSREDESTVLPVATSTDVIKTLLDVLQEYKKCLDDNPTTKDRKLLLNDCNNGLKEKIKNFDFNSLLFTFLLADSLNASHNTMEVVDIPEVLSSEVQNKMNTLSLENLTINEGEFELLRSLSYDWRKKIITDDVWNSFLQKMRIPIMRHCFNRRFGSSPIPREIDFRTAGIKNVSFNADGSYLWYTGLRENPLFGSLFAIDVKTGEHLYENPSLIYLSPCWVNTDVIAYIDFNEKDKLILYDCVQKSNIERIMHPKLEERKSTKFDIWSLIGSRGKRMFILYHFEYDYGIGILDYNSKAKIIMTTYKKLESEELLKLLFVTDTLVLFSDYEKDVNKLTLYRLSLEGDVSLNDPYFAGSRIIAPNIQEAFSNGVVNYDGTKIAFIAERDIFIQPLNPFEQEPIKCVRGVENILSLAFSPDGATLMAGCDNGKIIAFDVTTGEKIGELLATKKQAFDENYCLAFNSNDTTFAVGGDNKADTKHLLITHLQTDWKSVQDTYVSLLNTIKEALFDKIILIQLLHVRSEEGKKPVVLTDAEKEVFDQFDPQVQKMFTNIGYVAAGQVGAKPVPKVEQQQQPTIQSKENFLQRIWRDREKYWKRLMEYFPSSG